MLNNTTRRCPACGVLLRQENGNAAVCPKCFREFRYQNDSFSSRTASDDTDAWREVVIILLVLGIVFTFATGLIPLAIILTSVLAHNFKKSAKEPNMKIETKRNVPYGTVLQTRADYLRNFRAMTLYEMPLGIYGERALHQIERLEQKQQALRTMLGKDHPFIRNGDEAERYILKNCKQILYRLKFCDQSNPDLCRMHAEYLEGRLADNEKILRDYENLVIEVTQLDLDMPETKPCLDVLADTLYRVRTQDGALSENFAFDAAAVQAQMRG